MDIKLSKLKIVESIILIIMCLISCSKPCNNGKIISKKILSGFYENDSIKTYIGLYNVVIDCTNTTATIGNKDTTMVVGSLFHY